MLLLHAEYGFTDLVYLLIASGANPNVKSLSKDTPLHYAVYYRKFDAAIALISSHVNLYCLNKGGFFALDLCQDDNIGLLRAAVLNAHINAPFIGRRFISI